MFTKPAIIAGATLAGLLAVGGTSYAATGPASGTHTTGRAGRRPGPTRPGRTS